VGHPDRVKPVTPTRVIGGRYVVLAELGRGGMGVVWRAEDRVMGRQVAVKELHLPAGLGDAERRLFRERLLREARTAGRLNHPGIVTVYDVLTDGGVDHIVMELIEARTLADVVAESGPLDERSAAAVAQQLLDALQAAHDNGVVHRDVKPSNVMLGARGRVTLTDFGIAQSADDPRLTTTGSLIGSPGYLAPERLDGHAATPASDLWSLGATLYHAVAGTSPFSRDTTAATIWAVLHGDVPTLPTRGPLGAVIGGLLQRDPRARLGGPQAAALLAGSAAGPPGADTATTPVTRHPDTASATRLAAAPRRRRWWPWLAVAALLLGVAGGGAAGYALFATRAPEAVTLTYGDRGEVPVFEVSSSYACTIIAPAAGKGIESNSSVDCDERHEAERFAVVKLYASNGVFDYPGEQQLRTVAASTCRFYFDSPLVVGADKSRLEVIALVPSETEFQKDTSTVASYHTYNGRDLYCMLRSADGSQLEGTRVAPQPS
jgi:eukaryotic-like serine/threonine-protein kinase